MLAVSFTLATARDLAYLVAIAGFIFALKGLSSPRHARLGNWVGAAAATLAIGMTFTLPTLRHSGKNLVLAIVAMVLGAAIAVPVARFVKMTAMPQLVAIFNGVGGGAAALISIVELLHLHALGPAAGRLRHRRGAARRADRIGVLLGQRDRVHQAAGADHRAARSPTRASR